MLTANFPELTNLNFKVFKINNFIFTMRIYLISMILHPTRYEGGMAGICSCSPDQISLP